jgi:hypothetical protein
MKGSKRCMALILTIILTISVSIGAVFAEPNEIDYSQWDTQAAYPPDLCVLSTSQWVTVYLPLR